VPRRGRAVNQMRAYSLAPRRKTYTSSLPNSGRTLATHPGGGQQAGRSMITRCREVVEVTPDQKKGVKGGVPKESTKGENGDLDGGGSDGRVAAQSKRKQQQVGGERENGGRAMAAQTTSQGET